MKAGAYRLGSFKFCLVLELSLFFDKICDDMDEVISIFTLNIYLVLGYVCVLVALHNSLISKTLHRNMTTMTVKYQGIGREGEGNIVTC